MEILEKELSFYICESWKFQCLLFYAVCVLKKMININSWVGISDTAVKETDGGEKCHHFRWRS